jgi:alpha-galactosidase
MREIAEVAVDSARAVVYEHGWQSWSPSTGYRLGQPPYRPSSENRRVMNYRPDRRVPADAYQGEGLLAVDPNDGNDVHVFGVESATDRIASVRAVVRGNRVVVWADDEVRHDVFPGTGGVFPATGGLDQALGRWADRFAGASGVAGLRQAPTIWSSWYQYFDKVTEVDIEDNVAAMGELELDIDVVQIDDGYQSEIGDWLSWSHRFVSLADIVARIRGRGRRAGIWVAPFLVGTNSEVALQHPDWLVADADAGVNWGQRLAVLDVTNRGAEAYLRRVFGTFRELGIDFYKIDFVYAGALAGQRADPSVGGVEAYRRGLRLIREAIGVDAYLLACGAPILPSVGLVDAMRIGPDTAPHYEPVDGDMSQPSQRAAALTGRGRAWQQGRFWVNDPDCLLARPDVQRRVEWARHVGAFGGLRGSSDRLRELDAWGLETTRRLVTRVPATPFEQATTNPGNSG